jgi:hypothetical protein
MRDHRRASQLVQALTDRREYGPFAHFPLAAWSIERARGRIVLCADLTEFGPAAAATNLYFRPHEAATRFGQLAASLWPDAAKAALEGEPFDPFTWHPERPGRWSMPRKWTNDGTTWDIEVHLTVSEREISSDVRKSIRAGAFDALVAAGALDEATAR